MTAAGRPASPLARLTLASLFIAIILSVPAGVHSARRRNRWDDRLLSIVSLFGLFGRQLQGFEQLLQAGALVALALVDVGDVQLFRAQRHRVADAGRDDGHLDAAGHQKLQAEAVVHMEHLGFMTILGIPEAAVGERAL